MRRRLPFARGLAALLIALACLPADNPARGDELNKADEAPAAEKKPAFKVPEDVTFRTADIISEGTRMAAEVFAPKNAAGGEAADDRHEPRLGRHRAALRPDAIVFAQAGYLVVAFDYRGWGNSDSRLVAVGKPEKKDGKLVAEVKEVREVVDPIDQTTDILNAIHWAAGEKQCDPDADRPLGLVVLRRARGVRRRPRPAREGVRQPGRVDGRPLGAGAGVRDYTFSQGAARTHGQARLSQSRGRSSAP